MSDESGGASSSTMAFQKPPDSVEIDVDGDLCVKVGQDEYTAESNEDGGHDHGDPVIFLVDSHALSRSSPVWKKMLNGAFAESARPSPDSGEDWNIELPDDDPTSMRIILNIIHGRFKYVPCEKSTMSTEVLYRLTVLTDKYDLTPLLLPWASTWTIYHREHVDHALTSTSGFSLTTLRFCEMSLWISWELGDDQSFEKVYKYLVLNSGTLHGHLIQRPSGTRLFTSGILEPSDVSSKYTVRFILATDIYLTVL